jgi:hypothetical protein
VIKNEFTDLSNCMQKAKTSIKEMNPHDACELLFKSFVNIDPTSPSVWGTEIRGDFFDYLFGNDLAKRTIEEMSRSPSIHMMPLYVLNYIFDADEISVEDLPNTDEESAQYSLHVVGIVFDKVSMRAIVVDPNGPIIPGANIEFVEIPVRARTVKDSTCLSKGHI